MREEEKNTQADGMGSSFSPRPFYVFQEKKIVQAIKIVDIH